MCVSLLVLVATLSIWSVDPDSAMGLYIAHRNLIARQNTDLARRITNAFDVHIKYPYIWFSWLLLPVILIAVLVSITGIMLISGIQTTFIKCVNVALHAALLLSVTPLLAEMMIFWIDLDIPAAFK
ncbi:unnamed protein product, partial [Anisakis simplex]|uniref:ABC transmembrane type-1 domain-containing protein n=1 Tax=Anisakis simplex TaxID=6269 RepID=A0A0M3JG21_ANISI